MEPATTAMIASAAAPVIGGIAGNLMGAGDRDKATEQMQAILDEVMSIQIPEERALKLEELRQQGFLTPEMEQAIIQQDTEMQGISLDPKLREQQLGALDQLRQMGEGGMTLSDKARQTEILNQAAASERGMREAGLADLRRRGMAGSGLELMAQQAAAQDAAQRASQQGLDLEASGKQRALEALIQAGNMSGDIRNQDFGEQAKIAQAQDLINQFNVANRMGVQERNVGTRNVAAAQNLEERQRIADANVAGRNEAERYNIEAPQRQFNNQMTRVGATGNARQGVANTYTNQANNTAQMWGGLGQAVGQGIGGYGANRAAAQEKADQRKWDESMLSKYGKKAV